MKTTDKRKKETTYKSAEQNIVATLRGKRVLFLENDNNLANGLEVLEELLKSNKIEYKTLFRLFEMEFQDIIFDILTYDVIVFQTRWMSDYSKKLSEYMRRMKDKKIVIECFISEPTFYYKPDSVHDVYIFNGMKRIFADEDKIEFYKLHKTRAYWDFENKFDR